MLTALTLACVLGQQNSHSHDNVMKNTWDYAVASNRRILAKLPKCYVFVDEEYSDAVQLKLKHGGIPFTSNPTTQTRLVFDIGSDSFGFTVSASVREPARVTRTGDFTEGESWKALWREEATINGQKVGVPNSQKRCKTKQEVKAAVMDAISQFCRDYRAANPLM